MGPLHSRKVANPEHLTKVKPLSQITPGKVGKLSLHTQGRPSTQVDANLISQPEHRIQLKQSRGQAELNKAGATSKQKWSAV